MRFLFALFSLVLFAKEPIDVLFYLQDAGETYALLPVIEKMKEEGFSLRILTAGLAEELVQSPDKRLFSDYGVSVRVDKSWSRPQTLGCLGRLTEEIEPKVVVTGVAYVLQGQVLKAFKKRGASTYAFWDNFSAGGENPYFATARRVARVADTLLLPSKELLSSFPKSSCKVVGQPTLEEWSRKVKSSDVSALRNKLGIDPDQKVALFIGGYGADFDAAYELFLKCAETSDTTFLIQPHPKIGRMEGFGHRVLQGEVSAQEAVALADLVLCHQSTVSIQALASGKAVIHIIPKGQHFDSIPIQKKLAQVVSSPEEFNAALNETLAPPAHFYEMMGLPEESTALFTEVLKEAIRS
jgi:hypothetical protein